MDKKTVANQKLISGFRGVLNSMPEGSEYTNSIPRIVEDLPVLTSDEVENIYLNEAGEATNTKEHNYKLRDTDFRIEGLNIKKVSMPIAQEIDDLEIFGIDGSTQRIDNPSFSFILARATIVNFRYTSNSIKPYFYTIDQNASAVTQIDGNIFSRDIRSYINNNLYKATKNQKGKEKVSILNTLKNMDNGLPYLLGYNHEAGEKSPSAHALGWAVKFMNALELMCLKEIPIEKNFICIKDGPLFSASSTKTDTKEGMKTLEKWGKGVLIAVSKRIADSRLFIDLFSQWPRLIDHYFKGQNVDIETLKSLGTDSLILPRILKPGYRTPLIKAIPYARVEYVKNEKGEESPYYPLICYYMRRTKPFNIVRLEIPKFFYDRDPENVERAIEIVAWQFEIGIKAPLVQLAADERCQLKHEIDQLRMQLESEVAIKNLPLTHYY